MSIIKAPFTDDEVYNLNKWQSDGRVHPFTCGTKEKHKPGDSDVLIAISTGWVCPSCDYTQNWAHAFMTSPIDEPKVAFPEFPEMDTEEARRFLRAEGYDPDELAAEGVNLVLEMSLIAKIKLLASHDNMRNSEKIRNIKRQIDDYEEKKKSKDSSRNDEGKTPDNDV